ncbi:hypothetical protein Clacol_008631 [Clathrus columnatus]|uniref:Uncharacterized protein n=1 Tax=Clathrus columnatus TaxID=1419009 RepID=A0AAV5AL18_9AGAM|nr:hypothetical protein Clacol_008631 [Clathrus columnatus]
MVELLTNSTSPSSTFFGLPIPSLNFGNNIIDVSSLTTLIGSTTGEILILGNRGPAGIAWASTSSFGILWMIRACVNGASPGWLREMIGIRSTISDSVLGMSLDWDSTHALKVRKKMPQAIAIVCENHSASSSEDGSNQENSPASTTRDVYAFDRSTASKIQVVPETGDGSFRVFAYADYTYIRIHNTGFQVTAIILSLLKFSETAVLHFFYNAPLLAVISTLPWIYFFIAAVLIEIHEMRLKRIPIIRDGELDIIAGTLPTVTHPGGSKRIILGLSKYAGQTIWWRVFWGAGAVLCLICLIMTYFIMGQQTQGVSFVWICFQTLWMLARMALYHLGDFEDPHGHRTLSEKMEEKRPKEWRSRVLRLTASVAKYQTSVHPRGDVAYKNDSYSIEKLCQLYRDQILDLFPLSLVQETITTITTIKLNILKVVGDPILSSASWIVGENLTPMDLYDSCIVTFSLLADRDDEPPPYIFSVPAARVYSYTDPKINGEENISLRQYVPKGTPNIGIGMYWWYFIPATGDKWLVIKRSAELGLGNAEGRIMSVSQLTTLLLSNELDVDVKDVDDLRKVVGLSRRVCKSCLLKLVE